MTITYIIIYVLSLFARPTEHVAFVGANICDDILCLDVESATDLCMTESTQYLIFSFDINEEFSILSSTGNITDESLTRFIVYPIPGVEIEYVEVLPGLNSTPLEHDSTVVTHVEKLTIGIAMRCMRASTIVVEGDLIYQAADAMRCFSPIRLPVQLEVKVDGSDFVVSSSRDTEVVQTGS